jgi:hypothetical protein
MGVAKASRNTVVKAKAAPVVNGAFRRRVDHGGGGKFCANGRAAVDNRQQWQQQSESNQLKVTVSNSGVGCRRGGSKQQRSTAIGSKMPTAKAIVVTPPIPLLLSVAGSGGRVAAAAARE